MNIYDQLYEKLSSEHERFLYGIKQLTPEAIIDKSYEINFKREIYEFFESGDFLSEADTVTLLSRDNPLQELYEGWQNEEPRYLEHMRDSIVDTIREMPRTLNNELSSNTPVKPSIIERLKNSTKKVKAQNLEKQSETAEQKRDTTQDTR